jgi:hypothetical protein
MPRPQCCADHLILLGEMLDAACQYLKLCDSGMDGEPQGMIALAFDQLHPLSQRSARLSVDLTELEKRMRRKLFLRGGDEPGPPKPKGRSARSGS